MLTLLVNRVSTWNVFEPLVISFVSARARKRKSKVYQKSLSELYLYIGRLCRLYNVCIVPLVLCSNIFFVGKNNELVL